MRINTIYFMKSKNCTANVKDEASSCTFDEKSQKFLYLQTCV